MFFTPVCHSVHRGECLPLVGRFLPHPLGRHPPMQTPPGRHPLGRPPGRHSPSLRGDTPKVDPPGRHPLSQQTTSLADTPPAQCMLRYTSPLPSACWDTHPLPSACWDTVYKQTVHIPLECILVVSLIFL